MRTFKLLTLVAAISMLVISCSKEDTNFALEATKEAVNELESFKLAESGFTITETEALGGIFDDMYTQGILEYSKDGEILATVDFGNGTDANAARLNYDGVVTDIPLDRPIDRPTDNVSDHIPCFRFVYPITYIMPDGSEITGESKQEIHAALRAWYEAHPDVHQKPELVFPVQLAFRHHDEPLTVNNYQELRRAYNSCDDRPITDCHGRFLKRIVRPLVRAEDCGREPVSGIIKFYTCRTHRWVATINFGNGECDDLALKITPDGETVIVISEWFD